ncbi:Dabb family protein [Lutibacter sp. TH_r2]|uniref:Dabb family protein n=1 Tax=Lutibacter sp. TH_r2 TaxID=3082083 RepID=UPI002955D79F|nr:Dabb family protein [Lutibacter sp. TH_r2]MDV7188298.1 Dabb family protein [Lutibacter sp. TH_r2]
MKTITNKNIEHSIYFWLKNPENSIDKAKFENAVQKLIQTTAYFKNTHFGKPANIHRAVVDSSYTYCLKVTFENMDQHNKYQIDPAHKVFISEAKELWEKVLIYDSEPFN